MKRKGFANLMAVVLIATIILDSLVLLSIPPNPSDTVLRAKFIEIAKKYNIPSVILMGIAYTESGWKQFDSLGNPIIHTNTDGSIDIGIMQINSNGRSDIDRLKTDVFYNIEIGAKILDNKWKITPAIGDSDRNILENWYYAIWAYNGFSYINHPLNPNGRHYQDKVIDNIAKLIIGDDGQPLWTPVNITKPDPNKIGNPPSYIDTPTPYHFGDLYANPNDNARIVQANTDLVMPTNTDVVLKFLIQNVGTSTWSGNLFSNPYKARLTLTNSTELIEKVLDISTKVLPGETFELNFPVNIKEEGTYNITLEFFNKDTPFGQKVLSKVDFKNFSIQDLNPQFLEVSNYTINLSYKINGDYLNATPYLFVNYKDGSKILSYDLVKGKIENGLISFTFLPNFKVQPSLTLDTYISLSKVDAITKTFSYFYSSTYSVKFNEANGIILNSYPLSSISLDNVQTPFTTPTFIPLTTGTHTITLTLPNYNPATINLNFSSFDYLFVPLQQSVKNAPQISKTTVDFGTLKGNEARFVNVVVSAPEKMQTMFLMSNARAFSFYPSSVLGSQVITIIADARFADIGVNSGSITCSYSGVRASISTSLNLELVGATLKPNPNSLTVRVDDQLSFDIVLSSNVPINSVRFTVDYPSDKLEFLGFSSNYLKQLLEVSNTTFEGDLTNLDTSKETTILTLTFKAKAQSANKVLINLKDITIKNSSIVNVFAKPLEIAILEKLVKPSKVYGFSLLNNVNSVEFSFLPSSEGSYPIKDYEIYRSKQPDISTAIYIGSTTSNRFTDSGPFETNTTYYYWVIAIDTMGNSSQPSEAFQVKPIVFSDTIVKSVKLEFFVDQPYYFINGIKMPMDAPPIIIDGRTFVPVRYVAEPLSAQVVWKSETRTVIIVFKDTVIELYIGNPLASVNGKPTPIDKNNPQIAPFIKNGRTMLPLRFVTENLGAVVSWDGSLKKITITYNN